MTPEEVPADLVDLAVEVLEDQTHEHCSEEEGCPGHTRPYHEALVREALADILPEHEKQVRERVAKEIDAYAKNASEKFVEDVLADKADGFSGVLRASAIAWTAKFVRGEVS